MAGCKSTGCVSHCQRGGGWVRKFLQTSRLAYLFQNAANLGKQISKKGNIARGNSSLHYASNIPQKGSCNACVLEFCGTNMNENSIPFINYAAHCTAWLSYGKRLWPSAAFTTCYLARNPPRKGS